MKRLVVLSVTYTLVVLYIPVIVAAVILWRVGKACGCFE